ncbi:serine/threonine-protein kinase [Amycolatopsis minnesotensis]|uniref:non-specific serine/threonine protein kinase n=2 Tax=Amycolatopsis minnesotensis TaxID=337894 RepID=A0ABN2Q5W1_9PSEU
MGVVWRAVDERLERSVAVKQILAQPGLSESERATARQRAMREAKNAARFQHPNAIVVFDIAEHGGDPCLVMEYLPSKSLSAILAEQPTLPLAQVARIGEQVAAALVAAHRAGIVHRDIKPGNILIDESGTTKITDFGISRAAGDLALTQTGLIGGTPAYLPPELARGSDPAPASDVFSLGATLYHALEGQPPYGSSSNQLALLYTAANGQVIPPRQSGQATALLMSLLRTEADERPTMNEARERLAALAAGEPTPTATAVSPPPFQQARQPVAAPVDTPGRGIPSNGAPPPWQRTPAAPATPPRLPTSTFAPAVPTAAAPHRPAATAQAATGKNAPNRKAIMMGSGAAGVLVVALIVFLVLNNSDKGESPTPPTPTSASASAKPPTPSKSPSTAPSSPVGQTPSSGKVEYSQAGGLVKQFIDAKGSAAGWGLLTPGAQGAFKGPEDFAGYWAGVADGYRNIRADSGSNADGSVNMYVDIAGGRKAFRVVNTPSGLKIDSDTHVG